MMLINDVRVVTWDESCGSTASQGTGFHINIAGHDVNAYDSLEKSSKRVANQLNDHGILSEKTAVVHVTQFKALSMELLAKSRTWVTHQPCSNFNNRAGAAELTSNSGGRDIGNRILSKRE